MQARTVNKPLLRRLVKSQRNGRSELAKAVGCSPHTVSNWLRPEYDWGVTEYHANDAAKFYGVKVDELFPLVGAKGKRPA